MNKIPARKLKLSSTTLRTISVVPAETLRNVAGGLRPDRDPVCSCAAHCSPASQKYCP
jgi:hypothetical protein